MEVAAFAVGNAGMNSTGGLEAENRRFRRLVHSMRQEADRNQSLLHAFFAADLELLSCNTLEQLLAYLFTPFRERFGLDAVTLILLDPEETARDLLGEALRQNQLPNLRLVARQHLLRDIHPQQEIYRGEADGPLRAACFPDHPAVVSCALLPLVREHCLIGSLGLGSVDPQRFHGDLQYDYVAHVASVVSVCIENSISRETLQHLSSVDGLTRVLNRRALNHRLLQEIKRCNRSGEPLAYVLLDIDHFKLVNDRFGHLAGDRILRVVAQRLSERVRATDTVARYGGEEFAILLPGCDLNEGLRLAEALREAVGEIQFPELEHENVTASLGLTICTRGHTEQASGSMLAEAIVRCADHALYASKRQGRNRTNSRILQCESVEALR